MPQLRSSARARPAGVWGEPSSLPSRPHLQGQPTQEAQTPSRQSCGRDSHPQRLRAQCCAAGRAGGWGRARKGEGGSHLRAMQKGNITHTLSQAHTHSRRQPLPCGPQEQEGRPKGGWGAGKMEGRALVLPIRDPSWPQRWPLILTLSSRGGPCPRAGEGEVAPRLPLRSIGAHTSSGPQDPSPAGPPLLPSPPEVSPPQAWGLRPARRGLTAKPGPSDRWPPGLEPSRPGPAFGGRRPPGPRPRPASCEAGTATRARRGGPATARGRERGRDKGGAGRGSDGGAWRGVRGGAGAGGGCRGSGAQGWGYAGRGGPGPRTREDLDGAPRVQPRAQRPLSPGPQPRAPFLCRPCSHPRSSSPHSPARPRRCPFPARPPLAPPNRSHGPPAAPREPLEAEVRASGQELEGHTVSQTRHVRLTAPHPCSQTHTHTRPGPGATQTLRSHRLLAARLAPGDTEIKGHLLRGSPSGVRTC